MEIVQSCMAGKQYLVIKSDRGLSGYEAQMLEKNVIAAFLPFYTVEKNGDLYYWYDVTGKMSVEERLKKDGISFESLDLFFSQMHESIREISGYLIDEKNILFRVDTMFLEEGGLKCMYYPSANDGLTPYIQIGEFLITNVDPKLQELNELCYEIFNLMSSPGFECSEIVKKIRAEAMREQEITESGADRETEEIEEFEEEKEEEEKKNLRNLTKDVEGFIKEKTKDIKQTINDLLPDAIREESVLKENKGERYMVGRLIYDGEERELDYCIDKDLFKVGREDRRNDACLHSEAVSKHHSKILRKNGKYYLADWNSKKGTYYNGRRLRRGEYVELAPMDRVTFADVPYTWA